MGHDILVDGYNIIKNSASFQTVEAKNFAAARSTLITQLVSRYRHTPHRVTVVFDGDGASEQISHDRRIRIIYSRHNETADSVIARLASEARQAGREVEMYSNDGEVQQAVAQQGGSVHSVGQLTRKLNAPPSDVERRYRYRAVKKQQYGLNSPSGELKDEPEWPQASKGSKKKAGRRHHGRA